MADDLLRASGLWLRDSKRGRYMGGRVEEAIPAGSKLLVFKNSFKKSDTDSDYVLWFVNPIEQPEMKRAEPGQWRQDEPAEVPDEDFPF